MPVMTKTAAGLDDIPGIRHAFFTRHGGVSRGPYDSLNCGLGSLDDPEHVAVNRARAAAHFAVPAASLVTAYQVHSAEVAVVDRPWPPSLRPQVDALVTRTPGIVLGVLSADCAPVLLADGETGVVAAAHAGWRGAKAGVLEATVAAMIRLGAKTGRIIAAVGPCIQQGSYEVGSEFRATFTADEPETKDLFRPADREGHFMFDLPGYVRRRLAALAVKTIDALAEDTAADAANYFSYRRTTLAGGGDYGRGLSAIALVAD
jgi:YfiH family protein